MLAMIETPELKDFLHHLEINKRHQSYALILDIANKESKFKTKDEQIKAVRQLCHTLIEYENFRIAKNRGQSYDSTTNFITKAKDKISSEEKGLLYSTFDQAGDALEKGSKFTLSQFLTAGGTLLSTYSKNPIFIGLGVLGIINGIFADAPIQDAPVEHTFKSVSRVIFNNFSKDREFRKFISDINSQLNTTKPISKCSRSILIILLFSSLELGQCSLAARHLLLDNTALGLGNF